MINVTVIAVGKLKESYLRDGCGEYIKRLGAFAKVNVVEISEERASDNPSQRLIENISMNSSHLCFVIGGSFGLSESVKSAGRYKLSFGKMTLPHQLARMVLLEQIYRAFSISNNSKYHK